MEAEADLSPPIPSWVVIEPGIYCKDLASYRGNGVVLYSGSRSALDGECGFIAANLYAKSDRMLCGASQPGSSFSIIIWTLIRLGYNDEMEWVKDSVIESDQLWAMEGYNDQPLPRVAPQFPLLSMENPHIIHFVLRERDLFDDKTMMWFVTVDIFGKKVLSYKDIKAIPSGEPDEDTHSIFLNTPFFPIEFPKYLKKPTSSNIIEAYARSHLQTKRKKKLAWRKMDLS